MSKGTRGSRERQVVQTDQTTLDRRDHLYSGSKVEEILNRATAHRPSAPGARTKEITNGSELYERMVDEHEVLPYPIQHQIALIALDSREDERERNRARKALAFYNQRWVIAQARSSKFKGRGVSVEDLIQAGNIGLMEAIDQFEPERGNTFITYAKSKIFMRMQRLTEEDSATLHGVRVPVDRYNETHVTVKHARDALHEAMQREPTADEVYQYISNHKDKKLSKARVAEGLRILGSRPVSMQSHVRAGDHQEDLELGHIIHSEELGPQEEICRLELSEALEIAFQQLNAQEQMVFGSYIGYGDWPKQKSLKEIAKRYNLKDNQTARLCREGREKMAESLENAGFGKTLLQDD